MKNIIKIISFVLILSFIWSTYANNIKSYQIDIKQKPLLTIDFLNSYKKLKKFKNWEKIIEKVNQLLLKNKDETKKLVDIYNKIWLIREKINKNSRLWTIQFNTTLDYIQYRIWYILYSDKDVAKIKFGIYYK